MHQSFQLLATLEKIRGNKFDHLNIDIERLKKSNINLRIIGGNQSNLKIYLFKLLLIIIFSYRKKI
jgi:hypothetical protein